MDTMSTASSLASGLDCASPESIMDPTNLTPIGDQYGLGCVLYYCLAGQYPFPEGTAAEKMMAHQFKQPRPIREIVPDLPEGLIAIVDRLMQKLPEARYASSSEVAEALRPFVKALPAGFQPAAPVAEQPRNSSVETTRPQAPSMDRTPRPPLRGDSPPPARSVAAVPVLPSRQSLIRARGGEGLVSKKESTAPTTQADAPLAPSRVSAPSAPTVEPRSRPVGAQARPGPSVEERLGPVGIVICALVVSALAWLVTWKLF